MPTPFWTRPLCCMNGCGLRSMIMHWYGRGDVCKSTQHTCTAGGMTSFQLAQGVETPVRASTPSVRGGRRAGAAVIAAAAAPHRRSGARQPTEHMHSGHRCFTPFCKKRYQRDTASLSAQSWLTRRPKGPSKTFCCPPPPPDHPAGPCAARTAASPQAAPLADTVECRLGGLTWG